MSFYSLAIQFQEIEFSHLRIPRIQTHLDYENEALLVIGQSGQKSFSMAWYTLVLCQTQFVGSEFGIFGGFGWVRSLVLVGEPGFGRV